MLGIIITVVAIVGLLTVAAWLFSFVARALAFVVMLPYMLIKSLHADQPRVRINAWIMLVFIAIVLSLFLFVAIAEA